MVQNFMKVHKVFSENKSVTFCIPIILTYTYVNTVDKVGFFFNWQQVTRYLCNQKYVISLLTKCTATDRKIQVVV